MNLTQQQVSEIFDKADKIINEYRTRRTHLDISAKFNIPVELVGIVTRLYNFSHTRYIDINNLNNGKKINPIVRAEDMTFLLNYNF